MRSKPMAENGNERLEEIRKALGLSQSEMSLAIGFKTEGGYNAALRLSRVSEQLLLAAEGLLMRRKPNGHDAPRKMFLVEIDSSGNTTSRPLPDMADITLNGQPFKLLPVEPR